MTNLRDYEQIRTIIDEIIGVNTRQGELLKVTIKKYFEEKPLSIKLVNHESSNCDDYTIEKNSTSKSIKLEREFKDMEEAMDRYNKKIVDKIEKLKAADKYRGVE